MKTYYDCISCFVRQALDAVRQITSDEAVHEELLRKVLSMASTMDMSESPPAMARKIHRLIKQLTETPDPYEQQKKDFNDFALKLYPEMRKKIDESENPFETAVRIAIAGNIIDLGVKSSLSISEVENTIENSLIAPLAEESVLDFQRAAASAESILYLGDNAGEIVFDRFLIEQIGTEKITFAVRGRPIINDATIEDAKATGLTELVKVIDNGDDAPGTILQTCSEQFRRHFNNADLIISKGQGNYETLSDVDKDIIFILKAKCPVVAEHFDCEIGTLVLHRNTGNKKINCSKMKG